MKRIALFAGTTEGRRIAEYAAASGIHMDVYCATEYGTSLMPASEYLHPFTGRLDASMIREALRSRETGLCVDATHPYASEVSANIRKAADEARESGITLEELHEMVDLMYDGDRGGRFHH